MPSVGRVAEAAALVLGGVLLNACTVVPASNHARPPLPVPSELEERFRPGEVARVDFGEFEPVQGVLRMDGTMVLEGRERAFSVFLPLAAAQAQHPFMLVLPILAGGRALSVRVAMDLAGRGFASGFVQREGSLFRRGEDPARLDGIFRDTVAENRAFLSVVSGLPWVDGGRMGLVGISLGGIVGGVLAAVDPRILAASLCLAGGDLPSLVVETPEGRVQRWAASRREDLGLTPARLEEKLRMHFEADPALFGAYVDPARVLLYTAGLDRVVPRRNADLLWEAMGRPRRLMIPLGHYTTALVHERVMEEVAEFSRARLGTPLPGEAVFPREAGGGPP